MSAELVRFGVAMDSSLLTRFDDRIARQGYATRSEALRDLVRADLSADQIAEGGQAAATLTIVYDHHVRELTERLTEMQHRLGTAVVSTLHVHLDHDYCLEVIVMRGAAGRLREAGDRLIATKGVQHGELVITAMPGPASDKHAAHEHDHAHEHDKAHAHAAPKRRAVATTRAKRPRR